MPTYSDNNTRKLRIGKDLLPEKYKTTSKTSSFRAKEHFSYRACYRDMLSSLVTVAKQEIPQHPLFIRVFPENDTSTGNWQQSRRCMLIVLLKYCNCRKCPI